MDFNLTLTDNQVAGWTDQLARTNAQRDKQDMPALTLAEFFQQNVTSEGDRLFVQMQKRQQYESVKSQLGLSDEDIAKLVPRVRA